MKRLVWAGLGLGLLACVPRCGGEGDGAGPTVPLPWSQKVSEAPQKLQEVITMREPKRSLSEEGLSCDDTSHTQDKLANTCVTKELSCGQTIEGHTKGGVDHWSNLFYRGQRCTPLPQDYDGPERIYRLTLPARQLADITLATPCADLDLFALVWSETGRCPTEEHNVTVCDSDVDSEGGHLRLFTDHHPQTYLIAIDGKRAAEAPFRLKVECQTRRE